MKNAPSNSGKTGPRLEIVQALRAVAVMCVVISHISHELAGMLSDKVSNFNSKLFPGDFGVDLFFTISGFIMVYTCWNSFQKPGATLDFMRRRVIRIVPLYWVATTLMILVVLLLPQKVNTATSDVQQWISSYLFLPYAREADGLVRPVLGLGWSLQYEMLFYGLFAICLLLPRGRGLLALLLALPAVILAANFLVPESYAQSAMANFLGHSIILEFGAGVVIGYVYCSGLRFSKAVGITAAVSGLVLLMIVPGFNSTIDQWRAVHYGLPATLMLAAAILTRDYDELSVPRPILEVGESSYAIYLTHPFVIGATSLIFSRLGYVETLPALNLLFTFSVVVLVVSVVAGYFVHYLFDLPFTNWLRRRWTPRSVRGLISQNQGNPKERST